MELIIQLEGSQTEKHCSLTSSINACEKLDFNKESCRLFKQKLIYDYNAHAYRRCIECKKSEK